MVLIVGGAFQGKKKYVSEKLKIDYSDMIDGAEYDIGYIRNIKCVYNFQDAVKKFINRSVDPIEAVNKILSENPYVVIIMNEVGNGIVPIDREERKWREAVGKTGCFLAENAETVYRVVCGCAILIKGE